MANKMMILVDFDGAISTEAGFRVAFDLLYLAFSVLEVL